MSGENDQVLWRGVRPVDGIRGIWPERNATRIYANNAAIGSTTTIVYTVPSGKILFIGSGQLSSRASADGEYIAELKVRDGSDDDVFVLLQNWHRISGQMGSMLSYLPALEVAAGDDVVVRSSHANLSTGAMIFGWLEDA